MQKPLSGRDAKNSILSMSDSELASAVRMLGKLAGVEEGTAERLAGDPHRLRQRLSGISEEQLGKLLSAYANTDAATLLESIKAKNRENKG